MAIKSDYISGTLTITQGSTAFTGTGTGWRSAEFKEGDTLIDITGATEYMGVIEAITGEATGTLTKAWEGPSLVNVPYRMRYQPDGARSTAQARNLIEILGNGNITAFALLNGAANLIPMFTGPGAMTLVTRQALVSGAAYDVQVATLADRAAYDGQDEGYAVLVSDIGDGRAAIYSKNSATSGDWSDPAYITGAVGPVVQIEAGTTTTLATGQDATVVVRPITDGYALDFGIPRGLSGADGVDGADGAVGATGPTGPRGEGLQIGATGDLAGRDAYDNEAEGFSYVDVENGNLYFRTGAPGNWSDPIPFGKGDKGDKGDSGATIVTTDGVGNGTVGPYNLNEAPASVSATWATISGVTQYNFTLSGNQITFGTPVPNGVAWQVKSSGVLSVIVPADGSIGASKINTTEADGIRTAIGAVSSLGELNDVDLSGLQNGNSIIYDESDQTWKPGEGGSTTRLSLLALSLSEGTSLYVATGDLFADGFGSLGMVDVANAINLDVSETSFLKPTSSSEVYSTTANPTLTNSASAGSQNNNTVRQVIPASILSVSGDRVRITFKGATTGPLPIISCYIGHLLIPTAASFDGTQIPLTFNGGSLTATVPTNGTLVSDPVPYALDENKSLVISMAFGSPAAATYDFSSTGYTYYSKAGNDAAAQEANGYATQNNSVLAVDLVEVRTSQGTVQNLTVNSEIIPSSQSPNTISGEVRLVPTDPVTINTDFVMDIRRNISSAWTSVSLSLLFNDGGTSVLKFDPVNLSSTPAGNQPQYRFRSFNNKRMKIAGTSLEMKS